VATGALYVAEPYLDANGCQGINMDIKNNSELNVQIAPRGTQSSDQETS